MAEKKLQDASGNRNPELARQVTVAAEFRARMYKPEVWADDPETLLNDLRVLLNWRSEIITDNAFSRLSEYACQVHRERTLSFGQYFAAIGKVLQELRDQKTFGKNPPPTRCEEEEGRFTTE